MQTSSGISGLLATACLLLLNAAAPVSGHVQCEPYAVAALLPDGSNAAVVSATSVPANGTYGAPPGADPDFPGNATGLPALCAVEFQVQGDSNSVFHFGLYLPEEWNNRVSGSGNTNFGGGIDWIEMAPLVHYGFATVSTDTGHLSPPNSAGWALGHPVAQEQWGHLAMHTSVVLAKQIINGYYGKNITYSYFSACSGGGRQGLRELQLYPEDFDGVVAGAAPWLLSHLHTWAVQVALANLQAPKDDNVTDAAFEIFNNEVFRQCDPQDGHTDGIVSDPYNCKFDYGQIQCNSTFTNTSACLTPNQVKILQTIYSDWVDKADNGTYIWPSFSIASDASGLGGSQVAPSSFGTEYVENFVVNDTNWDWSTVNASTVKLADSLNPGQANADMFDLSAFRKRGGKLLTYHGMADPLIPTAASITYYESVLATMGGGGASPASDRSSADTSALDDFYRLFLVPGMHHCSGSNDYAPWYIAGGGQQVPANSSAPYSTPGFTDARHDVVLAVMAWVENGTAPDSLVASLWHNNDASQGIKTQRPLCPYPAQAVYVNGSTSDATQAAAWTCQRKDMLGFPSIKIAAQGTADPPATTTSATSAAVRGAVSRTGLLLSGGLALLFIF